MSPQEIRELSDSELGERLEELRGEHFDLRFAMATGQLDNLRRLQQTRRDIARVLTIQRERAGALQGENR